MGQRGQGWRASHGNESLLHLWGALRVGEHKGKALEMQMWGISQGIPLSWPGVPPFLPVKQGLRATARELCPAPRGLGWLLSVL